MSTLKANIIDSSTTSTTDIRPGDDLTGFDSRVIAFVEATFVS